MKIYKYTPHICEFLKSSTLKITPIQQLNDPFENAYTENALQDWIALCVKHLKMSKKLAEELAGSLRKNQKLTGVISFSKCAQSIPMLAYYANNFKGGILEFEIDPENPMSFFNNSKLDFSWGDVDYVTNRYQKLPVQERDHPSKFLAFQKHKQWQCEDEARFVGDFRFADSLSLPVKHRLSQKLESRIESDDRVTGVFPMCDPIDLEWLGNWESLISESDDFHPLVEINKSALIGVYLGCRFPNEAATKDIGKFNNLNGRIVSLDLHANEYSFEGRPIS